MAARGDVPIFIGVMCILTLVFNACRKSLEDKCQSSYSADRSGTNSFRRYLWLAMSRSRVPRSPKQLLSVQNLASARVSCLRACKCHLGATQTRRARSGLQTRIWAY
jgi:hypothetical protein